MSQEVYRIKPPIYLISDGTTKALQEIPLLIQGNIPDNQSNLFPIDIWMRNAHEQDQLLGIKRPWIPCLPLHLPNRPESFCFKELAKAIGETAQVSCLPETFNQACWLMTLQYFQQARGVLFASQQVPGVILNSLSSQEFFSNYLPQTSLKNLEMIVSLDLACYRLIEQGEELIKKWATKEGIFYPFQSPTELFLQILREEFELTWQLQIFYPNHLWLNKHTQEENHSVRVRLLSQNPWLDKCSERKNQKNQLNTISPRKLPYHEVEPAYLQFLRNNGWCGYWLLALREQLIALDSDLGDNYIKAFRKAQKLFINELYWRKGQPYKTFPTSRARPVEAQIDHQGYIHWVWSERR